MEEAYHSPQPEKSLKSIKYEGNLYKRGRGKKLSFVKPWRVRRFVLDTRTGDFTYYKDIAGGQPQRKGHINVSEACTVKVRKDESGKDHSFKVTVDGEDLYLACSNDVDINMWVDALNYCSRRVMSPSRRPASRPRSRSPPPDRVFFIDPDPLSPPSLQETRTALCIEQSICEQGDYNAPSSPSGEEDDCADVDEGDASTPSLNIEVISSDGCAISVPNFSEVVRGLPSFSSEADESAPGSAEEEEEEEGEFSPLDDRFQDILVSASDFSIDTEQGVCGAGAFGTVYRATRGEESKVLALKFFGYAKRNPESLDIVGTEIDVMLKLRGSEVFAQIDSFFYDSYEGLVPHKKFIDAYPVIVMEYLQTDLLSFLAASSSQEIASALPRVFGELVQGLENLHARGFLHRDLKVDNVMISSAGRVKLIDFGFLVALEEGETQFRGAQAGTIGYFAPESIPLSGLSVFSAKSDIWQAGVILYTLVSGKMPFNISSFNIRKANFPPLACPSWEPHPDVVRDLVANILRLNPGDRFSTSDILSHEWLASPAGPPTPEPTADTSHTEYKSSIQHLIQRRTVKKMLQLLVDDAEGDLDRSFKAESILESLEVTGGATYFLIRLGALKALIVQNLAQRFNLYDTLSFTEFCQLMSKNAILEVANRETFSRFCHEHGYYTAEKDEGEGEGPALSLTVKELLLTLIALVGRPDQDDDALACFLKFDTQCSGFLEKDAMLLIFRGLLEDEAAAVCSEGGDDNELDMIERELREIESVFSCVEVQAGRPGLDFTEFKQFHDSVMKISTRVSTRLSMRGLSVMSMAAGRFADSLHSMQFRKQEGMAKTIRGLGETQASRPSKGAAKKGKDLSRTL